MNVQLQFEKSLFKLFLFFFLSMPFLPYSYGVFEDEQISVSGLINPEKTFLLSLAEKISSKYPVDVIVLYDESKITKPKPVRKNAGLSAQYKTQIKEWKKNNFPTFKTKVLEDIRKRHVTIRKIKEYDQLPMNVLRVNDRSQLIAVINHPSIVSVFEDKKLYTSTDVSLPLIAQPQTINAGFTGNDTTVAVLDTGVDYTRNDFGNCTSPSTPESCKVIVSVDIAGDDSALDSHGHGTNVSGIISNTASRVKLAVLDVFEGNTTYTSTVIAGINWAINNQMLYNIVAINLSLSDGSRRMAPCGTPFSDAFYIPMQNARATDILPVAASGNNAYTNGITSPACVTGVVSVGAVYDSSLGSKSYSNCSDSSTDVDKVTCFSNSAYFLDFLAPGALISSGGYTMAGTSQATPHVSAAIAILRAAYPTDSLDDTFDRLKNHGVSIIDHRNDIVTPRLNLHASLGSVNDDLESAIKISVSSGQMIIDNNMASKEENEPNHGGDSGGGSVWWKYTAPESGQIEISTEGSDLDTLLAVYLGETMETLGLMVENDDKNASEKSSRIFMQVVQGEDYLIATDGKSNSRGNVNLSWVLNPNAEADLGIQVDLPNPVINMGESMSFNITMLNNGPNAATNVELIIDFTSGFTEIFLPVECQSISISRLTCNFGIMDTSTEESLSFEIQPLEAGSMNVAVSIGSEVTDNNISNNVYTIETMISASEIRKIPMIPIWGHAIFIVFLVYLSIYRIRRR